jgi:uncharacterized protein (DUF934 family)
MPVIDGTAREIADLWCLAEDGATPAPHMIWQLTPHLAEGFANLPAPFGVLIAADTDLSALSPYLEKIALIAVNFPKFNDGRGFTCARNLRKYGFTGDIRAIGHVIPDQFPSLIGCGFSSIATPPTHPPAQWPAPQTATPQLLIRSVAR